ncbi:MAG: M14 family zinc carboxypeptidase, partial [Acidobacteriota bacterium]
MRAALVCVGFLLFVSPLFSSTPPVVEVIRPLLAASTELELPEVDDDTPSPQDYLGYSIGDRFTFHHRILDYMEHLAAASDRVMVQPYGESWEGRPLTLVVISSPDNLGRLDEIRANAQRLADGETLDAETLENQPAIVWLAFAVHGNESSVAEVAMPTAYLIAASQGTWSGAEDDPTRLDLDDLVVIIDPMVNPDGRERYVHGFLDRRGLRADPYADSYEHQESWPGGRTNHYSVDLNRDWPWQTQIESRHRLEVYRAWEPQVYVDYHEMGSTATYYFPPAADPVHDFYDDEAMAWFDVFGRGNAAVFDQLGWTYYIREDFDLYYPGYGDTYPTLRGSVGMTYEMAGGGRAGSDLQLADGRRLTLADRVARHTATAIATVGTAARHHRELIDTFAERRRTRTVPIRSYLWSADQAEATEMARLFDRHGIHVGQLAAATTLQVSMLGGDSPVERQLPAGTWVADTDQPLGELLAMLIEPPPALDEAWVAEQRERIETGGFLEFFDISAWSLPMAYNVETWVVEGVIEAPDTDDFTHRGERGTGRVGSLVPPQGLASWALLGHLAKHDIAMRWLREPLTLSHGDGGSRAYPAGTVFLPRQEGLADALALAHSRGFGDQGSADVHAVDTSWTEEGVSLGSGSVTPVIPTRIGLLVGEGVNPYSAGTLWHLFDVLAPGFDFHRLDASLLGRFDLDDFDVLIMPDGRWSQALGSSGGDLLTNWVEGGG